MRVSAALLVLASPSPLDILVIFRLKNHHQPRVEQTTKHHKRPPFRSQKKQPGAWVPGTLVSPLVVAQALFVACRWSASSPESQEPRARPTPPSGPQSILSTPRPPSDKKSLPYFPEHVRIAGPRASNGPTAAKWTSQFVPENPTFRPNFRTSERRAVCVCPL